MKSLSLRERRLVAVGLLVAVLAFAWLAVLQPLIDGFSERSRQREDLRARYVANERLVSRIPALRRAAEEQAGRAAEYALAANGPEQGGELLRQRLEESLARAGGEQRASEVLDAANGWVRASITGAMTHEQMLSWLQRLRSKPPYLVLDQLTVSADRAMNSNHLDLLDVRIEATIPLASAHHR